MMEDVRRRFRGTWTYCEAPNVIKHEYPIVHRLEVLNILNKCLLDYGRFGGLRRTEWVVGVVGWDVGS